MSDTLDLLSAAFAEYMTPDEDGTPLLLVGDLKHALTFAGVPAQLAPQLQEQMDPQSTGKIGFEDFVNVGMDVAHPAEEASVEVGAETELPGAEAFDLLKSKKKDTITTHSLARAAEKLKMPVSTQDLRRLVEIASTREEFAELYSHLHLG